MAEMNKIPCIKCTPELWEYIKPYLNKWGYKMCGTSSDNFHVYTYLIINDCGKFGNYNIYETTNEEGYNRELVDNVEEFLERAAKLKGFTYKRKDMEFHGIEIKPGMGIYLDSKYCNNEFYIVIPTKLGLAVVNYGQSCYWLHLDSFLSRYKNRIVAICDLATQNCIAGDILWEAPKEIVLTMDEIAKKFEYPVEQIKIVK